jgi:hypothetical protein
MPSERQPRSSLAGSKAACAGGAGPDAVPPDTQPVLTTEGKKGPRYFVDISPPWHKRILVADPVSVDPRMGESQGRINLAVLCKILGTLKTFPIQKPPGACIEDLQNRGSRSASLLAEARR